jgi:hypothetical protein
MRAHSIRARMAAALLNYTADQRSTRGGSMIQATGDRAPQVADIARVIHAEFDEMPGMRLTDAQVRRLWHLTERECELVLDHLCRAGELTRDHAGRYFRCRIQY